MSNIIVGVGVGGPAKFVATKVTYDSKFSGPYAGQTLVVMSTDSELDGIQYSVCKGNLSEAEAAARAARRISWETWASEACEGGGKRGHGHLRSKAMSTGARLSASRGRRRNSGRAAACSGVLDEGAAWAR